MKLQANPRPVPFASALGVMVFRKSEPGSSSMTWLVLVCFFATMVGMGQAGNLKQPESPHFRDCITNKQPGTCGQANRTDATREMVDEWDIGIIFHYLPDEQARSIREQMRGIPDSHWTQIDNKQFRSFGGNVKRKPAVDMDYKMFDLQLPQHAHFREQVEPLFKDIFKAENQQLSLFFGKYSEGSYVTSHTDGAIVTLDGHDRYDRKRAFLLYLNEEWDEADGGLFTDEEDNGQPKFLPGWNTVLTFRVPRYHLVTPVTAHKVRWSIYGWTLEEHLEWDAKFIRWATKFSEEQPILAAVTLAAAVSLVLWLLYKIVTAPPPPSAKSNKKQ